MSAMSTTCYRHPNRVTGASCTRCGRPICPDCMVEAPVGHHCPECVRNERKAIQRPVWQRTMRTGGLVTRVLIGINVLVFLLELGNDTIERRFAANGFAVALGHQYYRMITSAFLHAGVFHILFNMLWLWLFGVQIEAVLGRVKYLVLYLVAAFGGSVCSYWFQSPRTLGVGASGAVLGLFGAYFVLGRARQADTSQAVGLIVITLVFGLINPLVDNYAHIGGALTGGAVAGVFVAAERMEGAARVVTQVAGVAAIVGLLLFLTSIRTHQILA